MGNSFVLLDVSMEMEQFHLGEIGHTQKRCFPMGNSHLSLGKITSVTPLMTMIIEPEGSAIFLPQWKISKNRSFRICRIASLVCNSV